MIMWARPRTLAAPPMSFFISSMPEDGLMSRPPVSKVTPLPTSVTFGVIGPAPDEVDETRRAGRCGPTAWIIGKPSARAGPLDDRDGGIVTLGK